MFCTKLWGIERNAMQNLQSFIPAANVRNVQIFSLFSISIVLQSAAVGGSVVGVVGPL